MGASMKVRVLFLPAGTRPDIQAAKELASRLAAGATLDDLRELLLYRVVGDDLDGDPDQLTDEELATDAVQLRAEAERRMHEHLDELAASLDDPAEVSALRVGDLDMYATGGASYGDGPTEAYDAWDVVCGATPYPQEWTDALAAAAGFVTPGCGRPVSTVTVRETG